MQEEGFNNSSQEDLIDLKELVTIVWGKKLILFLTTFVFTLAATIYSFSVSNEYTSTAVLSASQSEGSISLSNLGQSSDVSFPSLPGLGIGGNGAGHESNIALEIMKSWGFIEDFIKQNKLEVPLLAVKDWDKKTNQLIVDQSIYSTNEQRWIRSFEEGSTEISWELYQEFSDRLQISFNKNTELITLSIEYYSPQKAQEWITNFVMAINKKMQERRLIILNRNILNLEEQILKTREVVLKEKLYSILAVQVKEKVLTIASPEYVFITVNRAMVPNQRSAPKRTVTVLSAAFITGIITILTILMYHYFGSPRKE